MAGMKFREFPSIARLSREMIVTEKIDGTNAQINIISRTAANSDGDEGEGAGLFVRDGIEYYIRAGSRNQWINPAADNFGFATWVWANADALLGLGEGAHFGEWWGSGIQRGYGLPKGEKRFSLFNVARWADERDREKYPGDRPACCGVVPILRRDIFDTAIAESCLTLLGATGSVVAPGFMKPEGIVVFHVASGQLFKKTLDKNDGHKGK